MKVLLTGIAGFVGSGLARALVADGVEVHGLVRPSSDLWRLEDIKDDLHLHEGDLLDSTSIHEAVKQARPDTIFHLGVYGAYPSQRDPDLIIRSSLGATMAVLAAAKSEGVGMVVNTGSSSEYGAKDHPMREDESIEPNSYYAVGKAAQTLYGQQFARQENLPVITLRLFSVYGPYEEPSRFIPTLLTKTLANEDVPLAAPDIARDFIYIDDVVAAYRVAATHPELSGGVFNVGTGTQTTLREAFDTAVTLTGSSAQPLIGAYESRSFDTSIWVADTKKAKERLGFVSQHSLAEGFGKTIEWVKEHHGYKN